MIAVMGMVGLAAAALGSLGLSVAAGVLLLKGTLRVLESAVRNQAPASGVTDFAEFARRTSGPLPANVVKLDRAA